MEVDAEVYTLHIPGDTYTEGEVVEATARIWLNGFAEESQEFFVGFSVKGPDGNWRDNDGTTGDYIEVDPGNTVPVHLEWEVESQAPIGAYDGHSKLWTDHPDDDGEVVDEETEEEAFEVVEEYELTVKTDGDGGVEIDPPGFSTTGTTETYENGTEVELTAEPSSGYVFDEWIGDVPSGDSNSEWATLTIDENKDITAVFKEKVAEYDLTIETDGNGSVWVDPPGLSIAETTRTYDEGTEVELAANPDNEYVFEGWTGDLPPHDEDEELITVVINAEKHLTASFAEETDDDRDPPSITRVTPNKKEIVVDKETTQDFKVEVSDPDNDLDTIKWYIDGELNDSRQLESSGTQTDTWSWTFDENEHVLIEASVTDIVGNEVQKSWDVEINTTDTPELQTDTISVTPETPEPGDRVISEIEISNKEASEQTLYVDHVVLKPDGTEYVPGTTTEREVTLDSEEQMTISEEFDITADAPDGEYDVQITLWGESHRNNNQTRLDESWSYDAFSVASVAFSVRDVVTTPADGEVQSFETTPAATATLRNGSNEEVATTVEYRILDPDGELVISTTDELVVEPEGTSESEMEWPISADQMLGNGPHDLSITIVDEIGEELATETYEEAFVLDIDDFGRVDYALELYEANGDRPNTAAVTMEPIDGGGNYSRRTNGGSATFSDVPVGEYELTVEHGEVDLTESLRVFVGDRFDEQRVVFEAAEHLTGTVVDETGDQQIPNATVRLDGDVEATTDGLGMFRFDRRVPDGQYTLTAETPDGQTVTKEIDLDADRHVSIETDEPLRDANEDSESLDAEIIEESNHLVTIIARYIQNTEADDIVVNHYTDQIHGVVKGIIAGFQEMVGSLKETIQTILSLDLEKVIDGVIALLNAIYETRGKILLDMLVAMVADIPDALEAVHEQQEADNPYDDDNPRSLSFMSGWYTGYAAINLAAGGAIGRGITTGSRAMLSAGDQLSDSLQAGASMVKRADSSDADTAPPGEMRMFKRRQSTEEPGRDDGYSGRSDVIGGFAVTEVIHNAPHPELLRRVLKSAYLTNHRYRGKQDSENPTNDYGDPLRGVRNRDSLDSNALGNLQGNLAEILIASKFLSGEGRFPKVYSVMTEYDPSKVPEGKSGVVLNYDPDNFGGEFDLVQFEMRPRADGNSPEPVVTNIWESTTNTPEKVARNKKTTLGKIKSKVQDNMDDTDTLPGTSLPAKAFTRDGDPEIRPVRYLEEFGVTREQLRETGEYMFENRDSIDHILRPPTER